MAYTKRTWEDRAVEHPRRYEKFEDEEGKLTLIPEPGEVYKPGTPLNAANMNAIEQGIADAHETADAALPKTGGEMANTNLVVNLNADQLDGKEASDFAEKDHNHLVGGVNLIPKTRNFANVDGWTVWPETVTCQRYLDQNANEYVVLTSPGGASSPIVRTPQVTARLESGVPYTISIAISTLSGTPPLSPSIRLAKSDNSESILYFESTAFKRRYVFADYHVYTATATATGTNTDAIVRTLNICLAHPDSNRKIWWYKLEKGTIATDWSPALSDPASSVQVDAIYPVGAIYQSTVSTSPATLFGGTWSAISNPPTGASYWWERTA